MAVVCALVAIGGFAPTYWLQLAARTFVRPPLFHLHGALFTAWTLLLLSQTILAVQGRLDHHRAWGLVGISLAALSRHLPAPAQRVLDLDREVARRLPPQLAFGLRDIADQTRRVTGPARADAVRHGAAGNASGLGHHLAHAVAGAATDVEGFVHALPGLLLEPNERADMGVGQIGHMDDSRAHRNHRASDSRRPAR